MKLHGVATDVVAGRIDVLGGTLDTTSNDGVVPAS
jgi:hypothetical protein